MSGSGFRSYCRRSGQNPAFQLNVRLAGCSTATLEFSFRGAGDAINCPTNQQIIVQKENVACAKMRRAAEPELNAPPARDVERSK